MLEPASPADKRTAARRHRRSGQGNGQLPQAPLAVILTLTTLSVSAEENAPGRPGSVAQERGPNLGRELSAAEIEAIDQTVFADGEGLPPGSGNVAQGNTLFESLCASCHGPAGTGGIGPELAYGRMGLTSEWPDKTIGTYWPYATSLFDFLRRAMPMSAPGTLSDDESYALTAYLLYLNGIVTADTALDATALAHIRMPNRDGFEWIDAQPPQPQP